MWVKYNGIAFNAAWVASKSLREFMDHEKHHGLSREQFKEVHKLCRAAVQAPEPAEEVPGPEEGPENDGLV